MTGTLLARWIIATVTLLGSTACDECKVQKVASLFVPVDNEDSLPLSAVSYRQYDAGITCLDSRFFEISQTWEPQEMQTDYRSVSNSADANDFVAAGIIIRDQAAFDSLRTTGCLDNLSPDVTIDWSAQTVIVAHIMSNSGCHQITSTQLLGPDTGAARLLITVSYIPDDSCSFEYYSTVVVDQPNVRASMTLTVGCADDTSAGDN